MHKLMKLGVMGQGVWGYRDRAGNRHQHGRGSVLLLWRCDALCTSGFMDDVTFADNGQESTARKRRVYSKQLSRGQQGLTPQRIVKLTNGTKSAVLDQWWI